MAKKTKAKADELTLTFNGTDYLFSDMSDEAKKLVQLIQHIQQQTQEATMNLAAFDAAYKVATEELKTELKGDN